MVIGNKKKFSLSEEKFHYLIAGAALVSWLLYFARNLILYDKEELYSGIIFICLAAPFYAVCVFLYFRLNINDTQ